MSTAAPEADVRRSQRSSRWARWALVAVVALAVVAALQASLATYRVTSSSMAPTLEVGDRVLVERLSARFGRLEAGDVVVFRDPGGWVDAARAAQGSESLGRDDLLVKRVVAVGGERVACCEGGALLLDGRPLSEDYLPPGTAASAQGFDRDVPQGWLFVVGDNRDGSLDSRALAQTPGRGLVRVSDVVGVVVGSG